MYWINDYEGVQCPLSFGAQIWYQKERDHLAFHKLMTKQRMCAASKRTVTVKHNVISCLRQEASRGRKTITMMISPWCMSLTLGHPLLTHPLPNMSHLPQWSEWSTCDVTFPTYWGGPEVIVWLSPRRDFSKFVFHRDLQSAVTWPITNLFRILWYDFLESIQLVEWTRSNLTNRGLIHATSTAGTNPTEWLQCPWGTRCVSKNSVDCHSDLTPARCASQVSCWRRSPPNGNLNGLFWQIDVSAFFLRVEIDGPLMLLRFTCVSGRSRMMRLAVVWQLSNWV